MSAVYIERFVYDDGGRAKAGYKGAAGDCVARSIAIATDRVYQEVYAELSVWNREHRRKIRDRHSARDGVPTATIHEYLKSLGWQWVPAMLIGGGCRVHLRHDELPSGRLIVRCSRHLVAVIDGTIRDTHDCSRGGTRCVYGWWRRAGTSAEVLT